MPKYIDSEALKRDLIDNRNFYPAIVANAIEHAPACDVVEVVRCKDCKHYSPDNKNGLLHSPCSRIFAMSICKENSFCSYGERKEDVK